MAQKKILTGDVVAFLPGPGLLTLPNSAVVTCPGKYTLPAKGKYRFMPYTGADVSFTVSPRPADIAKVTTHELGEAPAGPEAAEPGAGNADDSGDATEKGAGD